MPMRVDCPRCRASMNLAELEFHLRQELRYFIWRCGACSVNFATLAEARTHFQDRFIPHIQLEGADVQATYLIERRQPKKDEELNRLYDLAVANAAAKKVADAKITALKKQRAKEAREARQAVAAAAAAAVQDAFRGDVGLDLTGEDGEESESEAVAAALEAAVAGAEAQLQEEEDHPNDGRRRSRRKLKRPLRLSDESVAASLSAAAAAASLDELLAPRGKRPRAKYRKRQSTGKPPPLPQIGDGKVACLLCGARHAKHTFHHHAFRAHMTARPFSCSMCPYEARESTKLKKHQRGVHGVVMGEGTFSNSMASFREEIAATIVRCFGDNHNELAHARFTCKACGVEVERRYLNVHASRAHLKEVTYSCRLCPFTSLSWWRDEMRTHVKNAHGQPELAEHNHQTHIPDLMPVVKGIVNDLFDVKPPGKAAKGDEEEAEPLEVHELGHPNHEPSPLPTQVSQHHTLHTLHPAQLSPHPSQHSSQQPLHHQQIIIQHPVQMVHIQHHVQQ